MVILIDNYDSFVCNLERYVKQCGFETYLVRNDKIDIDELFSLNPSHIVLSPGPCTPFEAGICLSLIEYIISNKINIPLLGVCLGHQAIAAACGTKIVKALKPMHGRSSKLFLSSEGLSSKLFSSIDFDNTVVARYHSLIADRKTLGDNLLITANSLENEIMAVEHKNLPIYGVQFHPESILTEFGLDIVKNFLST